jgi:hypothetical protein
MYNHDTRVQYISSTNAFLRARAAFTSTELLVYRRLGNTETLEHEAEEDI